MHRDLKRHFLKESEIKQFLTDFHKRFKVDPEQFFGSKPRIELIETQEAEIFISGRTPFLAKTQDDLFPTLLFKEIFPLLPKIVVDMGAIPHICNGADVMAPGIVRIDGEFEKDEFLLIVDERHGKHLSIGQALLDSKTMKLTKHGKTVKNLHHVGDGIWEQIRKLV